MRSIILSATALFLSLTASAQYATPPDYFRDLSLNVGVAPFTHPGMTRYVGDKNTLPITASANFNYSFTQNFQAGVDLQMTRWEAKGDQAYNGVQGGSAGTRSTTYLYADRVWSLTARANYMMPVYDDYHVNRANFYVGVAAGAAFTMNDGGITYTQADGMGGEENRYVSQFNYASGAGFVVGGQIGYTYYVGNHVGLNIECAPRYTHIYGVDSRYDRANHDFDVWSYPISVGVRVRF